ncbi:helix-turn-helix domain-containing protein [Cognatiyoonia sp. IB215182]|uniref:helix-turn-helix domain-containing protein n=1 Tax=Cognatiyoonia sp. IB215182 TaxID=3097353 RepID=UPI002A24C1C1|nr:helix-turn-helix domain-containing protein [Cognatiyoonia sp. IB215182]
MPDPRFNDVSERLRRIATDLENQAREHRKLADQLDHAMTAPERPTTPPPHLAALDAAALQLVDLPAAEIRTQAPIIARAAGQQVLPVAIRAQHLRAARRISRRRAQTLKLLALIANGATLKAASASLGLSEATGRRLRDAWREHG